MAQPQDPAGGRLRRNYLLTHSATGNTADGGSRTLGQSGLRKVYAGASAARYFGVPVSDPRHPDIWGIVQHGVVYTGGKGKIAEHGGADPDDRDVPILVYAPGAVQPGSYGPQLGEDDPDRADDHPAARAGPDALRRSRSKEQTRSPGTVGHSIHNAIDSPGAWWMSSAAVCHVGAASGSCYAVRIRFESLRDRELSRERSSRPAGRLQTGCRAGAGAGTVTAPRAPSRAA